MCRCTHPIADGVQAASLEELQHLLKDRVSFCWTEIPNKTDPNNASKGVFFKFNDLSTKDPKDLVQHLANQLCSQLVAWKQSDDLQPDSSQDLAAESDVKQAELQTEVHPGQCALGAIACMLL